MNELQKDFRLELERRWTFPSRVFCRVVTRRNANLLQNFYHKENAPVNLKTDKHIPNYFRETG